MYTLGHRVCKISVFAEAANPFPNISSLTERDRMRKKDGIEISVLVSNHLARLLVCALHRCLVVLGLTWVGYMCAKLGETLVSVETLA